MSGSIDAAHKLISSNSDFATENNSEHVDRIGGTFKLVCTPAQRPKLFKVLELVAYFALSLKLETQLRSDAQCLPLVEPETVQEEFPRSEPSVVEAVNDETSASSSTGTIKSPSRNLWGVFSKASSRTLAHSKTLPHSPSPSPPPTPSAFASFTSTFAKARFRPLKLRRTRSERVQGSMNALQRYETISTDWDLVGGIGLSESTADLARDTPSPVPPTLTDDASASQGEGKKGEERKGEKIESIIGKMRSAILSSSPGGASQFIA